MKEPYIKPAIESEEFSIEMMQGSCDKNASNLINLPTPSFTNYGYPTCEEEGCKYPQTTEKTPSA